MEGDNGRSPFAPSSPTEDPRQRRQQQYQQPYEFGTAGPKSRNYTLPPPPLPHQYSTPTPTSQHVRTHSRSFSGTPHVPYRVTVSGARRVDERNSDQEEGEREEEEEEEEEEQVVRGGGTLPIHINTPPPQF